MKTAMQELMQWMEETEFMVNKGFIDKVHECLEKEKEQIIDAYYGKINGVFGYREEGQEYYNQTYKPETI
jgi:hypothetical protein